jgi:flagellar FliJ protein
MPQRQLDALNTLLEREQAERDRALAQLREAEAQAAQARTQAEQLRQYRADYVERWTRQFRQGGTMDLVQCYQSFMQRLEQAVQQQAQVAGHAQARLDTYLDALRAAEMRVASVRKLIERRQQQLRHQAERADQRHTDEAAQRLHSLTRAARRAAASDTNWMML